MRKILNNGLMVMIGLLSILPYAQAKEGEMCIAAKAMGMPGYVVQEAAYIGRVEDATVFVDTKLKIEVLAEQQSSVPLFAQDVAMIKTSLPKGVLLLQRDGRYNLLFPGKGSYSVGLQFTALVDQKSDRNLINLEVTQAAISTLQLVFEGIDLDIQSSPAMSTQIKAKGKNTEFTAYLGAAKQIEVSWFAKPTALAKANLLFNSENNTLITISSGVINTRTFLNYKVIQGKLSQFNVSLPENMNLLTVKGENLKNWTLKKDKNKQILTVELTKEISDTYQLVLDAEEIKDKIEGNYSTSDIISLDAERENGYYAFKVKDDYKLRSLQRNGVSQLNIGELPQQLKDAGDGEANISLAYRFLRDPKELMINIEKTIPEISARNNILLDVSEEIMKLLVMTDYQIEKAGVFNFNLELPGDMDVIDVKGLNIENWKVNKKGNIQELEIQLRTKAIGEYRLLVKLEKPVKDIYQDIQMPQVNVLNVDKLTGFIGVACESSINLKTKHRSKLTETALSDLIAIPGEKMYPNLAYKFITQPYELYLTVEKVDPRVMADVFTFLSVGEGLVLVNSAVTFDVLFAGVDQFEIALPNDVGGVDITGQGIKAKAERLEEIEVNGQKKKVKIYTISLHSKVKGKYNLYCAYEKVLKNLSEKTDMPAFQVLGVERQTGSVAIGPRANVEIELVNIEGANQVDVKELAQDKLAGADIPILYALKYVRYPYSVGLDIKKHEDVSVLVAVVESANITTVLGKDGQTIVSAKYQIKNRTKQYLDITLPKNVEIWSTFVDGKAVKPAKTEENKILLPLVKYEEKDRSFPVEIIYEVKRPKFSLFGGVNLTAPQFDIPLTNVTWEVYMPFGYNYFNLGGNMELGTRAFAQGRWQPREQLATGNVGGFVDDNPRQAMPSVRRELNKKMDYERCVADSLNLCESKEEVYSPESAQMTDKQKDQTFVSNINSQIARYNQQLAPSKSKQVATAGRQKGVLPIHITIPTGGKLYTFSKLISREQLKVHAFYAKKLGRLMFLIMLFAGITMVIRYKQKVIKIIQSFANKNKPE
ncbi:MAG: hypothetical protein KJ915_04095 [Candidatus Omnitrophica bacterium]|nr:hypothetical protein [Candidatus Omnitrophota bacterium]